MAGRTKQRLAKMLTVAARASGLDVADVDPDKLDEAQGWYRTNRSYQNEALRWEGTMTLRGEDGSVGFRVCSWNTMTEIVRSGGVRLEKLDGLRFAYPATDAAHS